MVWYLLLSIATGQQKMLIDNCVNGYLVKPFDKQGYIKIVEYLIGDKLRLLEMSTQIGTES